MPSSHASLDELLPDAPEYQEVAQEAPPVSTVKPQQRLPFPSRKILRTGSLVLLTLSLAGSLTALAVMGRALSELTVRVETLDAVFRSGQIGRLTSNVSALETRLQTLEQQVAALATLPAAVQSANDEQASLKSAVSQLQDSGNRGSQTVDQLQTRVSSLEHDVQQSLGALEEINRKVELEKKTAESEKKRTSSESVKTGSVPAAKKIYRSVRRPVTPTAPFVLTGIERRGGQTFAVVIPRGDSQISTMRLLSPGDSLMNWTLRSTESGRAARFLVNGTEHLLQVE
ncbi:MULTISPECIES: plasmid transfer protein [Lonsdalea]|uniref:Plasmid transfer protein n=2 Tax=Lonsdalea TaxID=1082702 RepID=A0ACD1JC24_9GAMM|nr:MULTISPECIES: plasmid transfer protein [Lonsdalea]RAT12182.1 plasmid transfer protein [Lonsdalea quercina]RAT17851.1 plasmid transfer protein [Lonsdalea populi]RAT21750.1 plasmid transfer protein [Lonsdalea populi]RAT23685.1 plasmid transfer protein [Lonsdalea populi]RAT32533.1 plasmid transfer protein [Lonsdalea populi]